MAELTGTIMARRQAEMTPQMREMQGEASVETLKTRRENSAMPDDPLADRHRTDTVEISSAAMSRYKEQQNLKMELTGIIKGEDASGANSENGGLMQNAASDNSALKKMQERDEPGAAQGAEGAASGASSDSSSETEKLLEQAQQRLAEAQQKLQEANADLSNATTEAEQKAAEGKVQAAQQSVNAAQAEVTQLMNEMDQAAA